MLQDPRVAFELGYRLLCDLDSEAMLVIGVDEGERILFVQELYRGTAMAVVARPAEIFRTAVIENATRIVVIHNHPGGSPLPSPKDRSLLEQLTLAGEALGIKILDFQVVATRPAAAWSSLIGDQGMFIRSGSGEWMGQLAPAQPSREAAQPAAIAASTDAA
jgi:DNA repair protein RadC